MTRGASQNACTGNRQTEINLWGAKTGGWGGPGGSWRGIRGYWPERSPAGPWDTPNLKLSVKKKNEAPKSGNRGEQLRGDEVSTTNTNILRGPSKGVSGGLRHSSGTWGQNGPKGGGGLLVTEGKSDAR